VHAIRANEGVEIEVHAFLTSTVQVNGEVSGQVALTWIHIENGAGRDPEPAGTVW
jgi:hypothetical protein